MKADKKDMEPVALCEACDKVIYEGNLACFCADGTAFCEDHAYTLEDVVIQHQEMLNRVPFDCGELEYETRDEMKEAFEHMKADLSENGNRKLLTVA